MRGFTLIEVLVVIAIIGLLTSLIVPNVAQAQRKAKEAGVKATIHTLQAALETYQLDNSSYPEGDNVSLAGLPGLNGCVLRQSFAVQSGQFRIGDEHPVIVGRSGRVAGVQPVLQRGIRHNLLQKQRIIALVVQLHVGKYQHMVVGLLGNRSAVGVESAGLRMHGVRPHLHNLPSCRGRLLANKHIGGNDDGDQHGRNNTGNHYMAGTLGEFFTPGSIVDFVGCVLMEEAHSAPILA